METPLRLNSAHHKLNGAHHAIEFLGLSVQLFAALRRQPVEASLTVVLGSAPLSLEPALNQHPVEGRIKRAVLNCDAVAGSLLDALDNGIAVKRSGRDGAQDQQVKRARQQIG